MKTNFTLPENHPLINFLRSLVLFAIGLSIIAILLFYSVKLLIGDSPFRSVLHVYIPFGGVRYNFREIEEQPAPYLLTLVMVSSCIGSLWTTFISPKYTHHLIYQILAIPWVCVIITSPIWGFIWSISLRSPQNFVEHYKDNPEAVMWLFYRTDALTGLTWGWLSALQSFPINILSYVAFCSLLLAANGNHFLLLERKKHYEQL